MYINPSLPICPTPIPLVSIHTFVSLFLLWKCGEQYGRFLTLKTELPHIPHYSYIVFWDSRWYFSNARDRVCQLDSVQFSCSVVSDSLQPHGLEHTRLPCPSPTPRAYSNSCLLTWWCRPTVSSLVVPFSFCLQSFPASVSFQMSSFFASGGQSVGISASAKCWNFSFSISPSNEYSGLISFRMDWLDLLAVQGTLKSLLQHHSSKTSVLQRSAFFIVQLSHPCTTTRKTIALCRWTFVGKVMSLLFNMLSRLVITFLPRSKCLLISWLQPPSALFWDDTFGGSWVKNTWDLSVLFCSSVSTRTSLKNFN